jgi:MFS family permease
LRIKLFRTLWLAALVSNVGTWMQTVGAQRLVVHSAHAAILVSLVQTAYTLPAVLFALVGGVLAGIFEGPDVRTRARRVPYFLRVRHNPQDDTAMRVGSRRKHCGKLILA